MADDSLPANATLANRMTPRHRSTSRVEDVHSVVAERLTGIDARYTKTRRAVVNVFAGADHPLTVEEIRVAAATPLSSVYRTLTILEQAGLVHRFTNTNGEYARFELADDLLGHHHHLACATCGTMTDITLPDRVESALDQALATLARKQQFTIDGHRLDILGTCKACSAESTT